MTWATALRLGRVSNLPTVWSNVLAGVVLAGAPLHPLPIVLLVLAISLLYVAGMYLNDLFDRRFDAVAYPTRPIPSGAVAASTVRSIGFAGLAMAQMLLLIVGYAVDGGTGWPPVLAGIGLAATIVFYNLHHKGNPFGPFLMSLCRAQVYLTTALAVSPFVSAAVAGGMLVLIAYIMGLSYVAKQESLGRMTNLWPAGLLATPFVYGASSALADGSTAVLYVLFLLWVVMAVGYIVRRGDGDIRNGVMQLIAGIALLDALLIAMAGHSGLAVLAACAAFLTRLAHRFVPGT
ncbi:MAG: UbiA family prenyltransferase [Nitrospiraceae bacterium]